MIFNLNHFEIYNNMGNKNIIPCNLDVNIKGEINVYVAGNINASTNGSEKLIIEASKNYYILEQIFNNIDFNKNGYISSEVNHVLNYYKYEYRAKIHNNKKYNAFLFLQKTSRIFFDMLFEHFFKYDTKNNNKNVVLFFGQDQEIIRSYEELYNRSAETTPILIIVNNSNYSEQLKYINYVPDLDTIPNLLNLVGNNYISQDKISEICEQALVNYINTKLFRIDMYYNQLGYNLNMINPMNETYLRIKTHVTIALVGYSGCGKSTLNNLVFQELVARTSASATDVTTKCVEYYLPIQIITREELGQIRFLDFPGISEEKNYEKVVKPEIEKKLKEYNENKEQIDVALFFISNGINREFTNAGKALVELLHEKNIKIIFVINGPIDDEIFELKKQKLRNEIQNDAILYNDYSNVISTNFYQTFRRAKKTGLSQIFQKIIDIIRIKDQNFQVEDININNYNQKLIQLSRSNRTFELYSSINVFKERAKIKANITAAGYSILTLGSSAISIVVPFVDSALTIGYQVAMVFNILYIYEIKPSDYDIINIILSEGKTIQEKNKILNNKQNEISNEAIKKVIKDISNTTIIIGKNSLQQSVAAETGKIIVKQTIKTIAADSVEEVAVKTTTNTAGLLIKNVAEKTVTKSVEKMALESTKEIVETGIKEGTKRIIYSATKQAAVSAASEGGEQLIISGTKESVKTITETIIVKQGGRTWIVNLGKAVPFVGALISGIMNTYSTAALGNRLVNKFDEEFDNNQQRKVDLLKGRIYGLLNIIQQMNYIINDENNQISF